MITKSRKKPTDPHELFDWGPKLVNVPVIERADSATQSEASNPSQLESNGSESNDSEYDEQVEQKPKIKFYDPTDLFKRHATYNIVFGERSNGKTYAFLKYILEKYAKKGEQGALIRRMKEDFRGKRGQVMFEALAQDGTISKITNGNYTTTYYYSGKWYLANKDENLDKLVPASEPFCYAFALSDMEHDKSTSYPRVKTIFFDEFLTRQYYLPDEFVTFMNVISTIVRQRDDVTIIMAGNTVNKYCPYFTEMGLTHVSEMKKGSIEVYNYGTSRLKVAVEYADSISEKGKPSDIYFAFNNPKLEMITGGAWEIAMYPHMPTEYKDAKTTFNYFMEFNNETLQADILQKGSSIFTFIHRKTTPIKNPETDIVISFEDDPRPNHIRNLEKTQQKIGMKIRWFFKNDKVFYQDNEVGEIVRNYLTQCKHDIVS